MTSSLLIIDGYSLLHRVRERWLDNHATLESARNALTEWVRNAGPALGFKNTILVFDGQRAGQDAAASSPHLKVLYAPAHLTADGVIERLVHKDLHPERMLVISSDRAERETVEAAGARSQGCGDFIEQADQSQRSTRNSMRRKRFQPPGLGSFFPE